MRSRPQFSLSLCPSHPTPTLSLSLSIHTTPHHTTPHRAHAVVITILLPTPSHPHHPTQSGGGSHISISHPHPFNLLLLSSSSTTFFFLFPPPLYALLHHNHSSMAQDNPTSSTPSLSASAALALSAVRPIQPPPPQSQPSSRRVPPPCWTHEETSALIESYHEKWYSLRRGNLKASHWQEVADAVAQRCPFANPSKTSVQCRHKIEKLRKRYRTEKQRALTMPSPHRFNSSWVFFKKMDDMEKGPSSIPTPTPIHSYDQNAPDDDDNDNDEEEEDEDDDDPHPSHHQYHHHPNNPNLQQRPINNNSNGVSGFRFRIPSGPRSAPVFAKNFSSRGEENPNSNPSFGSNPRFWGGNSASKSGFGAKSSGGGGRVKRELDPLAEMVLSIRMLGEGFVKMEQMKMEMAREMEQMRMEMEMKRTEMILDSQQRIVEAFAKGFSAKKKFKRMPPSPES